MFLKPIRTVFTATMEAAAMFRSGTRGHDIDDVALTFLESEVGRFDYKTNWIKFKSNHAGILNQRIQAWLDYLGIDANPVDIVKFLDEFVEKQTGNWK